MYKNLIFALTTLLYFSNLHASTSEIGRAMEGKYQLQDGGTECLKEFTIAYREDGNPYYCAHNEGPRLELTNEKEEKISTIGCMDEPKHGFMDTYHCNFVWDVKTSKKDESFNVQIRNGRKCVLSPTKWKNVTVYSLKSETLTIKHVKSDEPKNDCRYLRL